MKPETPSERAIARTGLSRRQLARMLGMKESYLHRCLRSNDFAFHQAERLAALCGVGELTFAPVAIGLDKEQSR